MDAQGKPQRVQVVRHLGMGLDKKAVEAVRQYKFEPATLHGKPVAVEVNIEVNFRTLLRRAPRPGRRLGRKDRAMIPEIVAWHGFSAI